MEGVAASAREGTLAEVRFAALPVVPVFEMRYWPDLADTVGCGLCPRCTAVWNADGSAICLAVREDDDDGPGDVTDAGRSPSPSASAPAGV